MKKLLLLFAVFFMATTINAQNRGKQNKGKQKGKVMFWQLDENHGKMFIPNHIEPFSGVAYEEWAKGKNKSKIPFKNGIVEGTVIQWDVSGKKISETSFVRGVKHGMEKQYYVNGKPKVMLENLNGKPHGMITEYYETGGKKSSGEVINGTNNGKHTWWFKNGQKDQEVTYNMGKVNGTVRNWYPNGKQKMTAAYRNHGKQGKTIHWFPNGVKRSEQNYSRDVEVETSSFWENNGQLTTQKVYENGTLVKTMDYREASILTRSGYLHVFNKLNSNFTVRFNGDKVNPIDAEVLAFLVDGKAVEVAALPLTLMYDEDEIPENVEEILQKHKGVEVQYLKEIYEVEELPIEEHYERNRRGNQYLIWQFETPKKEKEEGKEEKKLLLKGEVNAVIVCQNHLLYLTAPVINAQKPADLQQALQAIIETIEFHDKPIDVIELSRRQ